MAKQWEREAGSGLKRGSCPPGRNQSILPENLSRDICLLPRAENILQTGLVLHRIIRHTLLDTTIRTIVRDILPTFLPVTLILLLRLLHTIISIGQEEEDTLTPRRISVTKAPQQLLLSRQGHIPPLRDRRVRIQVKLGMIQEATRGGAQHFLLQGSMDPT